MYYNIQGELDSLYDTGLIKGETVGFQDVDKLISFKKGATSYIYGTPASGKSEFWWECLINLSKSKGWKHLIFSPETGTPAEIFAEIIHKWAGKPFFDLDGNKLQRLTKQEMYRYGLEVSQYFYIMDLGVKVYKEFKGYKEFKEVKVQQGLKEQMVHLVAQLSITHTIQQLHHPTCQSAKYRLTPAPMRV